MGSKYRGILSRREKIANTTRISAMAFEYDHYSLYIHGTADSFQNLAVSIRGTVVNEVPGNRQGILMTVFPGPTCTHS